MMGKNGNAIWIILMQEGTNSMGIIFNKIYMVFVLFYWISPRAFSIGLIYCTGVQLFIHKPFFPSLTHQIPIQKVVVHFRKFCVKSPSPKVQDDYQWGISMDIKYWRDWRRTWKVSSWWMVISQDLYGIQSTKICMEYKAQVQPAWFTNSKVSVWKRQIKQFFFHNFSKDFI
jgi:hypothetical protein